MAAGFTPFYPPYSSPAYIRSGTLMPAFPTPVAASENQSVHSLLVSDSKVAPAHEIGTKVSRQLGRWRRILGTC